jgi:quinol monooxygenase YgiN
MIIYAGSLQVDPADRDAFVAARHEQIRSGRAEPGCLEYAISADPIDTGLVQIFEVYQDEAALAAHVQVHDRKYNIPVRVMDVFRYDVADRERLVIVPPSA